MALGLVGVTILTLVIGKKLWTCQSQFSAKGVCVHVQRRTMSLIRRLVFVLYK